MIYPRFPRRTLALIVFCLLITLVAVGILFLVYFFNESSTLLMDSPLKPLYGDEKQNQQYRQNIIDNSQSNIEHKSINRYSKDTEPSINKTGIGNNRTSILQNVDENMNTISSTSPQTLDTIRGKQTLLLTKSMNSGSNTNLDTIYIDDFDRPTYSTKKKSDNIDYFDTILVDHKNENKIARKLSSLRLHGTSSMSSIMYQNNFISEAAKFNFKNINDNERKSKINNKRQNNESRWNKSKLLRYTKLTQNARDDDDVYALEIDTTGSGSGDFVDDTEINEIYIKHINTKVDKNKNNIDNSVKGSNSKNSFFRKKHYNSFSNNDNEVVSLSPLIATLSSSDDPPIFNWDSQKIRKQISLNPTISSQITEQIHSSLYKTSQPFSESTNKKWPAPVLIFNHQRLANNESDNYSANSPTSAYKSNLQSQLELSELGSSSTARVVESLVTNLREVGASENNEAWIETRTRRIMGNVKKSEERSRQLLLCEEAGGGELCRMLFKGHIND